MDSNKEIFEVEFTEQCIEEMNEIYEYIANKLKEKEIAQRLISKVKEKVLDLSEASEMYVKIGKTDKLKREYHRIVINNFIILYTVDYKKRKVFISRMIYGRKNYLK